MNKRKDVEVRANEMDIIDLLDGDVTTVINKLETIRQKHGSTAFFKARYYGYDGGVDVDLFYLRPETDEEMAARVAKEAKALERKEKASLKRLEKAAKKREAEQEVKAQKEVDERAELARLQEKYNGES